MKNKRCENCGSTNFKEGRVGSAYHAYVWTMNLVGSFQGESVLNC